MVLTAPSGKVLAGNQSSNRVALAGVAFASNLSVTFTGDDSGTVLLSRDSSSNVVVPAAALAATSYYGYDSIPGFGKLRLAIAPDGGRFTGTTVTSLNRLTGTVAGTLARVSPDLNAFQATLT